MGRSNYAACCGDANHCTRDFDSFANERGDGSTGENATDRATWSRISQRGAFVYRKKLGFRDILDGLANTIMCGEIITDLGDNDIRSTAASPGGRTAAQWNAGGLLRCKSGIDELRPQFWKIAPTPGAFTAFGGPEDTRGSKWMAANTLYTGFHTMLAPNTETCYHGNRHEEFIASASSRHQGGAHVLMGDGAIKFITDSIEAGNSGAPQVTVHNFLPAGSQSPFGLWGALGTRANKEVISEEI